MNYEIIQGDCLDVLRTMPDESVQCCVTSPPYYGLRDYGVDGQIGLEETAEMYVEKITEVFSEVRRVLREDGTLWLNIGDSYSGNASTGGIGKKTRVKPKDLIGIPWMVAFALRNDGWYLRQDIIWHKPNPMPEPVQDRCTKSHEYIFLLAKNARYFFDPSAMKEKGVLPAHTRDRASNFKKAGTESFARHLTGNSVIELDGTRNRRSVWSVNTKPYSEAHFAVMPEELVEPCILAGSREGDVILDPFNGSGTVGVVALRAMRKYIGIELNPEYVKLAHKRIAPYTNNLFA